MNPITDVLKGSLDKLVLASAISKLSRDTHDIAISKGFNYDDGPKHIALMHSELSECLEAMRYPTCAPSEHIPDFTAIEEEFADVMLRVMGYCHSHSLRLAGAMIAKNEFNRNRPMKHGGKSF